MLGSVKADEDDEWDIGAPVVLGLLLPLRITQGGASAEWVRKTTSPTISSNQRRTVMIGATSASTRGTKSREAFFDVEELLAMRIGCVVIC